MSRLDDRLNALSSQKRQLVDLLLKREQSVAVDSYVAPEGELEQTLADIWRDVLGLKQVGAQDNFIALGGDSIRAIQISARARKQELVFSADQCFRQPTIRQLAAFLSQSSAPFGGLPPIRAGQDGGLLSYGEERMWLEHQLRPDVPIYNTFMAVRIDGALQVDALRDAIGILMKRHDTMRTAYRREGDTVRRVVLDDVQPELALLSMDASAAAPEDALLQQLAMQETQKPFDLAAAPLFRCSLASIAGAPRYLILTAHHIICDAWSMALLLVELTRVYETLINRLPSPLMPLPVSYADFAGWQRELVGSGRLAEQLAYWRENLQAAPRLHALPLRQPRPQLRSYRGRAHFFEVSQHTVDAIDEFAKKHGITRYIACLAAYCLVLYGYSRQRDLLIGTPVLGRALEETQQLVGFFLNTLVLRVACDPLLNVTSLVEHVSAVAADALRNQDMPYDQVLRTLDIERNPAHSPLFQLWFVMQAGKAGTLHSADVAFTPVELDRATSTFDLALSLQESDIGLNGWLEYDTDLFDSAFVDSFLARYRLVLDALPHAEQAIGELLAEMDAQDAQTGQQRRDAWRQRLKHIGHEQA